MHIIVFALPFSPKLSLLCIYILCYYSYWISKNKEHCRGSPLKTFVWEEKTQNKNVGTQRSSQSSAWARFLVPLNPGFLAASGLQLICSLIRSIYICKY